MAAVVIGAGGSFRQEPASSAVVGSSDADWLARDRLAGLAGSAGWCEESGAGGGRRRAVPQWVATGSQRGGHSKGNGNAQQDAPAAGPG